ncbi:taste receptor type 2 member 40-like [Lissotriton helveticus]
MAQCSITSSLNSEDIADSSPFIFTTDGPTVNISHRITYRVTLDSFVESFWAVIIEALLKKRSCCSGLANNKGKALNNSKSIVCWFTACLCIFYCVKIVDFSHPLFIRLKMRISKLVPWMLLGSVVGSIALSIASYLSSYEKSLENSIDNLTSNVITNNNTLNMSYSYLYAVFALDICLPLVCDIASMTLILISLCRHTQRMRNNAPGFSQPQLQAHYRAAKIMVFLLLNSISLLISQILIMCTTNVLMSSVCFVIIFAFLTAQPIVLILGNPKLRKALWKFLTPWRQ